MATVIFTSVRAKVWPMQFLCQTETKKNIRRVGKIQFDKSSGVGTKTPSRGVVCYYFVLFLLFFLNQIIKQYSQQIKNGPVNPSGPQNGVWKNKEIDCSVLTATKANTTERFIRSTALVDTKSTHSLTLRPLALFSSRMSCTYNRCTLCTLAHTTAVHHILSLPSHIHLHQWRLCK